MKFLHGRRSLTLWSAGALLGLGAFVGLPALSSAASAPVIYVNASIGSDLVGNGSPQDPYASIQAAVTHATQGSTILVEPGTYTGMVTIDTPLTLEADPANPGPVVLNASGQTNGILIQGGASNTTIRGLTIENADQADLLAVGPLTNLTIEDNTITGSAQSITPAEEAKFIDYEALHLEGVSNSLVSGNIVENNLDGGIYLTDEPGPSANNVITGNLVENNAVDCGITVVSHVAGHGVIDNTIANNVSENNGAAGVILATAVPGGIVTGNVVTGNTLSGNHDGGVSIHTHAPGSTVANNVVVDNTIGTNVSVQIAGTPSVGVALLGVGSPIVGTVIQGNTITGDLYGIYETPWLPGGTVVGTNTYAKDVIANKVGVSYAAMTGYAMMPPGFLGTDWVPAQQATQALVKQGITTNTQYQSLLTLARETPASERTSAQADAMVLFTQFHIIY
jgi:parallel beta-helix repeat protein